MNAVDFIKENVNPIELLEYYKFREIKEYETEIRACCEIHKGDNPNAFIWNKENNLWYCYTNEECGGGDAIQLIRKMENLSFLQAVEKAATIFNLDITNLKLLETDRIKKEQQQWLKKKTKETDREDDEYKLPRTTYYDGYEGFSRFDKETIEYYNAKFVKLFPTEKSLLKDKMVIPLIDKGKLYGVALRDVTGRFIPKWMYMPKGMHLSRKLYNMDKVLEMLENGTEEVIIVEGIFDVWRFHEVGIDNVLSTFSANISDTQEKKLLKLNTTLTLCFDNDKAGIKATGSAIRKFKNKTDLKLIELPEGKDPGDCTDNELVTAYIKRRGL